MFLHAEQPRRFQNKGENNGQKGHHHLKVTPEIDHGQNLSESDDKSGQHGTHPASQAPYDTDGDGQNQHIIARLHHDIAAGKKEHAGDTRQHGADGHGHHGHDIGVNPQHESRSLILGHTPERKTQPCVVGKQPKGHHNSSTDDHHEKPLIIHRYTADKETPFDEDREGVAHPFETAPAQPFQNRQPHGV